MFCIYIVLHGYCIVEMPSPMLTRDQARGRLGRNGRPGGRNFALNGTQGEVGVSLKKKKKKKKIFFFFFFFLGRLIFMRYNFSLYDCHFSLIVLQGEVTSP